MRIALVDPSRTTRLIVTRMLQARGHEVVPFADEREALREIAIDLRIDALITSAELTHMTGLELCWEARLLATCKRPIYVLMMSSQYDQRNLVEALDSGADDFIGKPPMAEELFARLRAAERIASMQRELLRLATTDPLTGCAIGAASSSKRSRRARGRSPTAACPPFSSTSTISSRSTTPTATKRATRRSGRVPKPRVLRAPSPGVSAATSSRFSLSNAHCPRPSISPRICAAGWPRGRSIPPRGRSGSPGASASVKPSPTIRSTNFWRARMPRSTAPSQAAAIAWPAPRLIYRRS